MAVVVTGCCIHKTEFNLIQEVDFGSLMKKPWPLIMDQVDNGADAGEGTQPGLPLNHPAV